MADVLVSIKCLVYNHEPYLRQCLDGFVMQKTSFAFEAIVHDDASTDNSAAIIREYAEKYPDIIKPIYETENQYSKHDGSLRRIMDSAISPSSKYLAICEGDDYWTDPLKLQKQYDIMEKHPDCTICFNRVQAVYEDGITPEFMIPSIKSALCSGYIQLDNLIKEEFDLGRWCFQTSSFFVTKAISNGYITFKKENLPSFPYGDLPLIMFALTEGMGYFIDETMGCYRRFSGGFCSSLQANREKKIKTGYQVIKGCEEFDKYTNCKYHKMILKKIKREEFYVIYNKMSLRPRHWEFLVPEIYKCVCNKTKTTIRKVFPFV